MFSCEMPVNCNCARGWVPKTTDSECLWCPVRGCSDQEWSSLVGRREAPHQPAELLQINRSKRCGDAVETVVGLDYIHLRHETRSEKCVRGSVNLRGWARILNVGCVCNTNLDLAKLPPPALKYSDPTIFKKGGTSLLAFAIFLPSFFRLGKCFVGPGLSFLQFLCVIYLFFLAGVWFALRFNWLKHLNISRQAALSLFGTTGGHDSGK